MQASPKSAIKYLTLNSLRIRLSGFKSLCAIPFVLHLSNAMQVSSKNPLISRSS